MQPGGLVGQEAPSPVVGFSEVLIEPGAQISLAPLFHAPPAANGHIQAIAATGGDLTLAWGGSTSGWADAWALPLTPDLGGRPFFLSPSVTAPFWNYRTDFGGAIFSGEASASLLTVGSRLQLIPFFTVNALAGTASDAAGAALIDDADQFTAGTRLFWARDDGTVRQWEAETQAGADAGPTPLSDIRQPLAYRRADAAAARRWVIQGTLSARTVEFTVEPGATQPTPLFRLDGRVLPVYQTVAQGGIWSGVATTGMVGGPNEASADKVIVWSPARQNWIGYYYHTIAKKWMTATNPPVAVAPSSFLLGGSQPFYFQRPASLPPVRFRFSPVPNAVAAGTAIAAIIDADRDRIADGWEAARGGDLIPTDDADLDGYTHFQEYLLGGDPHTHDQPAQPRVLFRTHPTSGAREAWVAFDTTAGCRYRVETWRASDGRWLALHTSLPGTGTTAEVRDTLYRPSTGSAAPVTRLYRVIGLSPLDTDGDLISDWEETHVYQTLPTLRDSDRDGLTDGAEIRAGTDPLEFYNRRAVTLTADTTSNRQVGPVSDWLRQAVAVVVMRGRTPVANAPITFVATHGTATFSSGPGGSGDTGPVITVRSDAAGVARAFVRLGDSPGLVQGLAFAKVPREQISGRDQFYAAPFAAHATPHLTLPQSGLAAHFRPDLGLTLDSTTQRATGWTSVGGGTPAPVATAALNAGPGRAIVAGRPWLTFNGSQKLDLAAVGLPNDTFSAYFLAAPTAPTATRTPSIAGNALSAGASGQRYLLASAIEPGAPVTVYDPPARPTPAYYSIWKKLYFDNDPFRRYSMPALPSLLKPGLPTAVQPSLRYDNTTGQRISPAPAGKRTSQEPSAFADAFLKRLTGQNAAWKNWNTRAVNFDDYDTTYLGRDIAHEDYYRFETTTWKGNSGSPGFGGVGRLDYGRVDAAGFGLSVGSGAMQPFEIRQHWYPATAAAAPITSGGFLGGLRVIQRLPHLAVNTVPRSTGSTALLKSTALRPPRYLGGWSSSGSGYAGYLSDLLLYARDLSADEIRQVEDYLTAAHRETTPGRAPRDTDRDGLPDWWERAFFGDFTRTATADPDADGSNALDEYRQGTHPLVADTDGDGLTDGAEKAARTNPTAADSDGDGLPDGLDTTPLSAANGQADADANGRSDGLDAIAAATGLTDTDANGRSDLAEALGVN
ncbi:MAG: thrombospondin type 3 repeat-containing protein [Verrucomicrobiales bacterium]|nr:thrombospondin type 3 repeat-containing protein [Verrucomicrobiales bacterium]